MVSIPLPAVSPEPGVEYWLNLSFRLAEDASWAESGHEVAWEQFKLDLEAEPPALDVAVMLRFRLRVTKDRSASPATVSLFDSISRREPFESLTDGW